MDQSFKTRASDYLEDVVEDSPAEALSGNTGGLFNYK